MHCDYVIVQHFCEVQPQLYRVVANIRDSIIIALIQTLCEQNSHAASADPVFHMAKSQA